MSVCRLSFRWNIFLIACMTRDFPVPLHHRHTAGVASPHPPGAGRRAHQEILPAAIVPVTAICSMSTALSGPKQHERMRYTAQPQDAYAHLDRLLSMIFSSLGRLLRGIGARATPVELGRSMTILALDIGFDGSIFFALQLQNQLRSPSRLRRPVPRSGESWMSCSTV